MLGVPGWRSHGSSAFLPALLLALRLLFPGPAAADPVNFAIICADPSWAPAFQPLADHLESDWDHEGQRPWVVEILSLTDSITVKAAIQARWLALQQTGGGDLFALLVADPSHCSLIPQRLIYNPAIAGADLGWGDYVPSDDLYADLDGNGLLDVITFRLPAQSYADCEAYIQKDLDVRLAQQELLAGGQAGRDPSFFWRVNVLCEDFDRYGRSGDLVRQHGQALVQLWQQGYFAAQYQGDDHPYDYFARESVADSLDNAGHQLKITLGTVANKVNLVNFQDQRMDPPWSVDHLAAGAGCYLHLALSCAHHAIDRPDGYGRPHVEQVLLAPDRGAFASLGFTRQAYEWTHYWLGEAISYQLIEGAFASDHGATVGRAWRAGRNNFLAAHPEHFTECASFCGLGDPTLPVVRGSDWQVAAPDLQPAGRLQLQVVPNPFNPTTDIYFRLPEAGWVQVSAFDLSGRLVRRILPRHRLPAGRHNLRWSGRDDAGHAVAAGAYLVRLTAGRQAVIRKVMLLK